LVPGEIRICPRPQRIAVLLDHTGAESHDLPVPELKNIAGEFRYEIVHQIYVGGMGVVYEAEQTAIDRKVALKVLHPHLTDESLYSRFRNEAAAASRLGHPNTITVYDPKERFESRRWADFPMANDGGQRFPNRWEEPKEHSTLIDPANGYRLVAQWGNAQQRGFWTGCFRRARTTGVHRRWTERLRDRRLPSNRPSMWC
jgi:hypothetical protein